MKVDMKKALYFAGTAWDYVTSQNIQNYYNHNGILSYHEVLETFLHPTVNDEESLHFRTTNSEFI